MGMGRFRPSLARTLDDFPFASNDSQVGHPEEQAVLHNTHDGIEPGRHGGRMVYQETRAVENQIPFVGDVRSAVSHAYCGCKA